LIDIESFGKGRSRRFIGVWVSGKGNNLIHSFSNLANFLKKEDEYINKGMHLIDVEVIQENGQKNYIGIWRDNSVNISVENRNYLESFSSNLSEEVEGSASLDLSSSTHFTVPASDLVLEMPEINNNITEPNLIFSLIQDEKSNFLNPKPLEWDEFVKIGEEYTKKGYRLINVEIVEEEINQSHTRNHQQDSPIIVNPPRTPNYVHWNDSDRLFIDFQNFSVHIPLNRVVLPYYEGDPLFPTNMCGMKVTKADGFEWTDRNGEVVGDLTNGGWHQYLNSIPDLAKSDSYSYYNGIGFYGPIGSCYGRRLPWHFLWPITKSPGNFSDSVFSEMRLTINLRSDSEVEFTDHKFKPFKVPDWSKMWKSKDWEKMWKYFEEIFDEYEYDHADFDKSFEFLGRSCSYYANCFLPEHSNPWGH